MAKSKVKHGSAALKAAEKISKEETEQTQIHQERMANDSTYRTETLQKRNKANETYNKVQEQRKQQQEKQRQQVNNTVTKLPSQITSWAKGVRSTTSVDEIRALQRQGEQLMFSLRKNGKYLNSNIANQAQQVVMNGMKELQSQYKSGKFGSTSASGTNATAKNIITPSPYAVSSGYATTATTAGKKKRLGQ